MWIVPNRLGVAVPCLALAGLLCLAGAGVAGDDPSQGAPGSPGAPGAAGGPDAPGAQAGGAADAHALPDWVPRLLGAQFTYIGQRLLAFPAAYSGPNSLRNTGDQQATDTYGLYFGSRVTRRLQIYLDAEMARGHALSKATGLAGLTNGDVIRQGTVNLGMGPYIARAYLRYLVPLGGDTAPVERGMGHFPGLEPTTRLELKAGKFALTDDFDLNRYANAARSQFMNWSLFNNTAWDYAADTRGYTFGVLAAWVHPTWTLRAASAQMPTQANGNVFDPHVGDARGDNLELQLGPWQGATIVRLLAYDNHARMGIYRDAIDQALATGTVPDIVADDRPGRGKYGFGLNLEQPLADGGETGVFARLGWNNGRTEDFVFTEVDRMASAGVQVAGNRWGRAGDRVGVGVTVHGLSEDHRQYLALGGLGFLLGDGALDYAPEEILESYYRFQLGRYWQISPDFQYIRDPGYNQERGPATVLSLRVNFHW